MAYRMHQMHIDSIVALPPKIYISAIHCRDKQSNQIANGPVSIGTSISESSSRLALLRAVPCT